VSLGAQAGQRQAGEGDIQDMVMFCCADCAHFKPSVRQFCTLKKAVCYTAINGYVGRDCTVIEGKCGEVFDKKTGFQHRAECFKGKQ
jgi:hypothetical protein